MDQGSRNSSKSENFFTDDSEDFFTKLNSSSIELSETTSDTETTHRSASSFSSSSSDSTELETVYYKHGPSDKNHHDHKHEHRRSRKSHKSPKHAPGENCIQVDLADLEASLDLLNKNLETNPARIPKSDPVYIAYENVKLFVSMFYGREEYPKILEIMNKYPKPNKIVPDTIGAFLFGCSQAEYGDISNKFCSPLCLQGILPNEQHAGASFCPYQVWVLNESTFEPISDNSSDHAYIFTSGPQRTDTHQFTPKQITLLRSLGIKKAQVLRTQDARHITLVPLTEIDNLPVVLADQVKPANILIKQANNTASVNSSRLLAILIILILIGVAVWLIFKYVIPKR